MKWKDEDGFLAQIKNEERFGIFLDMGTGKTSLTLALIDHKFFVKNYKKVLIITPKAVSPIRFKLLSDSNKKLLTILQEKNA